MREDRLGDLRQRHLACDHHHADADQRVGVVSQIVHADNTAGSFVGDEFDHAVGFAGDHRFGVDAYGHLGFHRVDAFGFGLRDRQADEAGLRAREGDAAVFILIVFGRVAEQVAGGDAALGSGGVSEQVAADQCAFAGENDEMLATKALFPPRRRAGIPYRRPF